jgi:hypothetical protein
VHLGHMPRALMTKCRLHQPRVINQRDISNPVLSFSFETSPRVFHPATREGPGTALVLSTQKSARQDWQAVRGNPTYQNSMRSKRPWAFGFIPKHSTALYLTQLVERVSRKFDEKRLPGVVFLDVAKASDTVRVNGLLYKLTVLNFPSYLSKLYLPTSIVVRSKHPTK